MQANKKSISQTEFSIGKLVHFLAPTHLPNHKFWATYQALLQMAKIEKSLNSLSDIRFSNFWESVAAMDLAKEVALLKAQLKEENDSKRILEEWINSSLKVTLEKHHAELKRISVTFESKILALEQQLEKEIATRKKLTVWVKDNLGPNLEASPFKDAVGSIISRRHSLPTADTSSASSTASAASSRTSTGLKAKKATAKPISPRKEHSHSEASAEKDYWTDESEEFVPTRPTGLTAPSSSAKPPRPASTEIVPSTPAHPNPVLKSRVQKLAILETNQWGEDDVTDTTFPSGDATHKTNKNRIEYYLSQQKHSTLYYGSMNLLDKTNHFLQKGAKIVFAPFSEADFKRDSFNFAILTNDRIFPICPDGLIRSQILYLVLQGIKRKLGVSTGVELPHGARSGYDPYLLQDHPTDPQQQFQHIPAPNSGREVTAFSNAFGVEKVPRFGQDAAGMQLISVPRNSKSKVSEAEMSEIAKNRRRMREYFDLYYYGSFKSAQTSTPSSSAKSSQESRIILMVFGSAVPIVIDRLSEVNYRFDLSKVTLLCLPYPNDRLKAADTKPEDYVNAYKNYAALFTPILEAS